MKIEIKCHHCGKPFLKEKKEYTRQKKKNPDHRFYCSKECRSNQAAKDSQVEKECKNCGKPFITTRAKKARKCCSRTCAAHVSRSHVDYKKISETLKKYYSIHPMPIGRGKHSNHGKGGRKKTQPIIKNCETCGKEFSPKIKKRKTCSKKCASELMSKKARANPNCGGETNYRRYTYKGILMDSSWEVSLAEWMDEKGIEWVRDKSMWFSWEDKDGKTRRYHPDFYLPNYNLYLDPKNKYLQEKDAFKINQTEKSHGIRVIYGDLNKIKTEIISL